MTSSSAAKAHEEERARQKARAQAVRDAEKNKEVDEKRRKKRRLILGVGGSVAFVLLLLWYGTMPLKGPIQYGICRTILELDLKFPQTIKMTYVETFDKSLRMYYTYTDAFGSIRSEMLECDFRPFYMMFL
jgi:hypothetical protein